MTFEDGAEMVEEYDTSSDTNLLTRKWKEKGVLGKETWKFEIGEPVRVCKKYKA